MQCSRLEHAWQSEGTNHYLNEHEDRHVADVEKHTFDGANTITLMKHKRMYMELVKGTRMDGDITVVII